MNAFECPFSLYSRLDPKKIALVEKNKKWSYRECHESIQGLCTFLKQSGVQENTAVAIPLQQYPSFPLPLLFFALFRLHAIAFPLSAAFPDNTMERLRRLANARSCPPLASLAKAISPIACHSPCFLEKEKVGTYLVTSGTTGPGKIAALSLGNHYYSAIGSQPYLPSLKEGGSYLLSLPLCHIAGIAILFRTFLAGSTIVLSDSKATDPRSFSLFPITHLSLVPTQLRRLLQLQRGDLFPFFSSIKCILLGGSHIPLDLYRLSKECDLPIYPTYGMTEMSSQITTATNQLVNYFSLGHPLPYRDLSFDKEGEILVKGKTLFQGYLREGQTVEKKLDQKGYFRTGDIGAYSPKTGLQIKGRKDRLFISGGENIYPEEIESALLSIRGIVKALVRPTPDPEFGMRPIAHLKTSCSIGEKELQYHLRSTLPSYKVPIAFFFT